MVTSDVIMLLKKIMSAYAVWHRPGTKSFLTLCKAWLKGGAIPTGIDGKPLKGVII